MLLGEILVRRGAVSADRVRDALQKKQPGERIGHTLVRLGWAREEDVVQALAEQVRIPCVDLSQAEVDPGLLNPAIVKTVFQRKVLPLDRSNGSVRVAVSDPLDLEGLDDLRLLLNADIKPVLGRPSDIERLIGQHYGVADDEDNRM